MLFFCTCLFAWEVILWFSVDENKAVFKFKSSLCSRNNTLHFLLCVSIDCAAERSCPQSSAPPPSQSTSSHTLSSAKSKGSLRRQSKSVVRDLLCILIFISQPRAIAVVLSSLSIQWHNCIIWRVHRDICTKFLLWVHLGMGQKCVENRWAWPTFSWLNGLVHL